MNCRDCMHFKACYEMATANGAEEFNTLFAKKCEDFADRSEWVHLPCKPVPLIRSKDPSNTDVYCPACGENLSGLYGEKPLPIVQCYSCGEIIDTTKIRIFEKIKELHSNDT